MLGASTAGGGLSLMSALESDLFGNRYLVHIHGKIISGVSIVSLLGTYLFK